jgi:excisionase family DNA binding protein
MANSAYRFSLASESVTGMAKILQILESKDGALKAGELAKLLGVTRQHIYKMAAASVIPSFRIGAAVRFDHLCKPIALVVECVWPGQSLPCDLILLVSHCFPTETTESSQVLTPIAFPRL